MLMQVLVSCLGSPSLDVTLAAMRATSAFIQVCCDHGIGVPHSSCACCDRYLELILSQTCSIASDAESLQLVVACWHMKVMQGAYDVLFANDPFWHQPCRVVSIVPASCLLHAHCTLIRDHVAYDITWTGSCDGLRADRGRSWRTRRSATNSRRPSRRSWRWWGAC